MYLNKKKKQSINIRAAFGRVPLQRGYKAILKFIFRKQGHHHRWRMVTPIWRQDSRNIVLLPHPQTEESHTPCHPPPQILPIKSFPQNHHRVWHFWVLATDSLCLALFKLSSASNSYICPIWLQAHKLVFGNNFGKPSWTLCP